MKDKEPERGGELASLTICAWLVFSIKKGLRIYNVHLHCISLTQKPKFRMRLRNWGVYNNYNIMQPSVVYCVMKVF